MTDADLFRIEQEAATPAKARRALFEAGREAERSGTDDLQEADDYLRSINQHYELRA